MSQMVLLLSPRARGLWNRWRRASGSERTTLIVFGVLGLFFWVAIFGGVGWLVYSFHQVEVFGPILTRKLLELLLLSLFALLCFSNVVQALSVFYLADDLELVLALPVSRPRFHLVRLTETIAQSSWMVAVFGLPVFLVYGVTYDAPALYYGLMLLVVAAFVLIPASIGAIVASVLVSVFPARRLRELFALAGIVALAVLFIGLRVLQPERLVNAESFESLAAYVAELQAPVPLLVPPRWASDVLLASLQGRPMPWLELGLLLSGAVAITGVGRWVTAALYDRGRARSQEARAARLAKAGWLDRLLEVWTRPLSPAGQALVAKDIKTFVRDPGQWSQVFLLASIVIISLFSVAALPMNLFRGPWGGVWRNVLSFLVLGLVGFVMAAVAARFQFPAVSNEGRAFWVVRTAPVDPERYLWAKIWPGLLPMLAIGEILAVASTTILGAGPFLTGIAAGTALGLAFGISGVAVGMGATWPDFRSDNAARAAAGPAGLLFMVGSLSLVAAVIALEALPVYLVLSADWQEAPMTAGRIAGIALPLVAAGVVCALATVLPVRRGARNLWSRETL